MGFTRYYSKELNFLFVDITGELNDNDLTSHVKALNTETEGLVNVKGFADCRGITKVNIKTIEVVSNAVNEKYKPGSKVVIFVPKDNELIFAMARAYQMFAEESCDEVSIYRDYDEALAWLTDSPAEGQALTEFINTHKK